MENSDFRIEELEVIVKLRHGPDCGARGLDRTALIDGNGWRNPFDALDVRFFHAVEELPCVGGKTLDIAPLTFCVEDIEGEGRFPRAAHTGNDREGVQGDLQVEVFQIILFCPSNTNPILFHRI